MQEHYLLEEEQGTAHLDASVEGAGGRKHELLGRELADAGSLGVDAHGQVLADQVRQLPHHQLPRHLQRVEGRAS